MDKYTKEKLKSIISDAEAERLKPYLIEAFSVLPKEVVDRCIRTVIFLEMDRWGEYLPGNCESVSKQRVIRISYETLSLSPEVAKFVFLHEIGHAEGNHPSPMSNRKLRKEQDKRADEFAAKHFTEWCRYFYRDKNDNLQLTELGKKSKNTKKRLIKWLTNSAA